MKVLLAGDTHASKLAISNVFAAAKAVGAERIFQLGDFGFWPRQRDGQMYLGFVSQLVKAQSIPLYWLAGNHEDWDDLDIVHVTYRTDDDGFHKYGNTLVAPRGHAWEWDGIRFGSLAGAFSIDRKFRTKYLSWFPQEVPLEADQDELETAMDAIGIDHIDIMLAHDAPENVAVMMGGIGFHNEEAYACQALLAEAVQRFEPYAWVHGHWHTYLKYYRNSTFCLALDQMTTSQFVTNMAVVDTQERTLSIVYGDTLQTVFEIPER